MSDYIKKVIERYREKTATPARSEVVSFRVTPEELEVLKKVYGGYTGIRDFALASTDTADDELDYEDRLRDSKDANKD